MASPVPRGLPMTPDQIAKQVAAQALSGVAALHFEFEVAPAPLRIDIVVDLQDTALAAERGALGALLVVDTGPPLLIEAVSRAVRVDQLRACINRQHALYQIKCAEARRREERLPSFPHLCVVSAGKPKTVMRDYALTPLARFPRGFYGRNRGDAISLVVVPELPRTRDTILLRLMGRSAALRGALEDVNALPKGAYERTIVYEMLKNMVDVNGGAWQDAKNKEGAMGEAKDAYTREERAAIIDFLKGWRGELPVKLAAERRLGRQEGRQEGWKEGRQEGRKKALQRALRTAFKARFGLPPRSLLPLFERSRSEAASNALIALVVSRPLEEVVAALGKEEG